MAGREQQKNLAAIRGRIQARVVGEELNRAPEDARPVKPQNTSRAERISALAAGPAYRDLMYDAMVVALSGRIFLDETIDLDRILERLAEHPAFWSDAAILSRLGQHVSPQALVESMLRIPARGLTNVAFPLQVAPRVPRVTHGYFCCQTAGRPHLQRRRSRVERTFAN